MNVNKLKYLTRTLPVIIACFCTAAQAQFHEIEMTVFSYGNRFAQEQSWPNDIRIDYPEPLTALSERPVEEIFPELVQPGYPAAKPFLVPVLGQGFSRHGELVRKLEQSGRNILFRKTWLQKIENNEHRQHIIIQGGKLEHNLYELGGSVSFYLTPSPDKPDSMHMSTRLWHVTFGPDNGTRWPIPASYATGQDAPVLLPVDASAPIQRIAVLDNSKIITPGVINYIDHPLFGILVEIRPYSAIMLNE